MGDQREDKPVKKVTVEGDETDSIISSDALDELDSLDMLLDEPDAPETAPTQAMDSLDNLDASLADALGEAQNRADDNSGMPDELDELTLDDFIDDQEMTDQPGNDVDNFSSFPEGIDDEIDTEGFTEQTEISYSVKKQTTDDSPPEQADDLLSGETDIAKRTQPPEPERPDNEQPVTELETEEISTIEELDDLPDLQDFESSLSASTDIDSETAPELPDDTEDALNKLFDDDTFSMDSNQSLEDRPTEGESSKQGSDSNTESSSDIDRSADLELPEDTEDALSRLFDDNIDEDVVIASNQLLGEVPVKDEPPYSRNSMIAEPDTLEMPLDEFNDKPAPATEIENNSDSNKNDMDHTRTKNTDATEKETSMAEKEQLSATEPGSKKRPALNLDLANSITMSLGLIAVLVAALAVWFGLDASQQAENLKSGPQKLQQQINHMEEQHKLQSNELKQQVETLQQQLNNLTKVVANTATESWQASNIDSNTTPQRISPATPSQPATSAPASTRSTPAQQKSVRQKSPSTAKAASQKLAAFEVAAGSGKGWFVNLLSLESRNAAVIEVRRLRTKGIKAEFVRIPSDGKIWFRVRISGFENERKALAYKKFLHEFHSINSWHHKL